jgi:hypothetical protein
MSRTNVAVPPAARAGEARRAWRRFADQTPCLPYAGVRPVAPERLRRAISWFADTPRGPEAFLTRFRAMPAGLRRALVARFDPENPWRAYREICRLYGV